MTIENGVVSGTDVDNNKKVGIVVILFALGTEPALLYRHKAGKK